MGTADQGECVEPTWSFAVRGVCVCGVIDNSGSCVGRGSGDLRKGRSIYCGLIDDE